MRTSVTIGVLVFVIAFSYTFAAMHFVPEAKVAFLKENLSRLASQQASVVEASHEEPPAPKAPSTVNEVIEVQPESIYLPGNMVWKVATTSAEWTARDSAASFVFNGKMWIMGGINGNGVETNLQHGVHYWQATHYNDIWSSLDGITWKREAEHAEWAERRSMSVVVFKDKLWMFAGWSPVDGYVNDVWQSTDGIHWKRILERAPFAVREGQTAEVFQGKMWMMGGVNYDRRKVYNDVWSSEDGIHWKEATATAEWSPRWDHAIAVFHDKLFLAGGMDLSQNTFNDVWSSEDGVTWEHIDATSWPTRQGHGLMNYKDALWIVGRLNDDVGGGINDVWYSLDGKTWEKTKEDPGWIGREDHQSIIFNDHLYIFSGMDANWHWMNDVWRLE